MIKESGRRRTNNGMELSCPDMICDYFPPS
jgi:hypothetical protein